MHHNDIEYSVEIEAGCPKTDEAVELLDALELVGALGPVVWFTDTSIAARFNVIQTGPEDALARALELFTAAAEKVSVQVGRVERADIMTVEALDEELAKPTSRLVGVTEVAEVLGVSRQRVSELRGREDFPAPMADLAAGPVWNEAMLQRFLAGWERKPGRPRRATA